jgi:hypothetical protein
VEIGPIVGVRPITMVKPSSPSRDLSGVFAIEFRSQDQDESYSTSQQRATRGLEDEGSEDEALVEENEQTGDEMSLDSDWQAMPHRQVSFFA